MRKSFLILIVILTLFSCGKDNSDTETDTKDNTTENTENKQENQDEEFSDYKTEMRKFVISISQYARKKDNDFIIIPQNGQGVVAGDEKYLEAIDGCGREDLYYGYEDDDKATPSSDVKYMKEEIEPFIKAGKTVLVTDYTSSHIKESYEKNFQDNYLSFAAPERDLNIIPEQNGYDSKYYPYNKNSDDINKLSMAKNFLYVIGCESGDETGDNLINKLSQTDYDVIIMDAFVYDEKPYTKAQINKLKTKKNGGKRLVISYMSIGEAENYRYYWQKNWKKGSPEFLDDENPDWNGNFKVKYWLKDWQKIIYEYTDKILASEFDGVYLDIIDAFEYFESKTQD
jgi:cysteinyl-tRNA synthetase